jgi:carboxymethylenebutenolidase
MDVCSEIVDAPTAEGPMAVLRKRPSEHPGDQPGERPRAGGTWPRIVMFHDGPGIRRATHDFAARLAAEGYDVAVPDLYHRHGRMIGFEPHEREADPTVVDRLWALLGSLTDGGVQDDLDATLEALGVPPEERLGTVGFCVGARAVFRTLMRLPERFVAGAMWHPSYLVDDGPDSPHLTAGRLSRPLFVGHGDADRMQPLEGHRPFLDAVEPLAHVEVRVFPGVDHAFTWPDWPTYDAPAAEVCFERTTALFRQALGERAGVTD